MTSGAPSTETEFAELLTQHIEHELKSKGYPTIPYEDIAWESHVATHSRIVCVLPDDAQTGETRVKVITGTLLRFGLEDPGHYDLVSVGFALGMDPRDAQYNPPDNWARLMIKTSP